MKSTSEAKHSWSTSSNELLDLNRWLSNRAFHPEIGKLGLWWQYRKWGL
jgi:hypothetical protein